MLGGYDVFEFLKDKDTKKADQFNSGYPVILDLEKLKCPCGKPFLSSPNSIICGACGTATCSGKCHEEFMQKENLCAFHHNFTRVDIKGLPAVRLEHILKMQKTGTPTNSQCSIVSPNFLFSTLGPTKNTIQMQRGFKIYGSPCV